MILKLNKEIALPFLLFTFPIVIDCLNGYLQGSERENESSIAILYRGAIVLYSFAYFLRYKSSMYVYLIFFSMFLSINYQIMTGLFSFSDISSIVKIMNIFFVLKILYNDTSFSNIYSVINSAVLYGFIAAVILIYCFVFNVGFGAYGEDSFGTRGFFIAMNDVGLTILLLNSLSCYCWQNTGKIKYLLFTITMSFGACLVGSMACFLGTLVILFCLSFSVLFVNFRDYSSRVRDKIFIVSFLLVALVVLMRFVINLIISDPYLSVKYEDVFAIITQLSGRDYLINAAMKVFQSYSICDWLFGTGQYYMIAIQHILFMSGPKSIEIDPLDLVSAYGIIFSSLLIWFPIKTLLHCIKYYFQFKYLLYYWLIVGISLFLGHAVYAGHAYTSPLVTTYLAVYIYLFANRRKIIGK